MGQVPYYSPVPTSSYPLYAVGLTAVGVVFMALFFVTQMRSGNKSLILELLFGALASLALGFGTLFIMLSFGLYV